MVGAAAPAAVLVIMQYIWDRMKEEGFVTMLGFEQCEPWISVNPPSMAQLPTDHLLHRFYCVAVRSLAVLLSFSLLLCSDVQLDSAVC